MRLRLLRLLLNAPPSAPCRFNIIQGLLHIIEGRFGTAVYQYFVLLRYLVILNVVTSSIFIVFLIVPQSVAGTSNEVRVDFFHSGPFVVHTTYEEVSWWSA